MYQKVIVVGRVGKDPELKSFPDGTPVASFNLASSRKWKNADGSPAEETTWFRVQATRRTAEVASQYLHKGDAVMVEGHLSPDKATGHPRIWTGSDGTPKANYDLTCDRLVLLGSGSSPASPNTPAGKGDAVEIPGDLADVPF